MKTNNYIYILLLIYSFQSYVLTKKYAAFIQREIEDELIDLIEQSRDEYAINHDRRSENHKHNVDPNDRVQIELWNELNAADIKNMPQTDDYSNESDAIEWLVWYLRVTERYHQISEHLAWNYNTNITAENQKAKAAQGMITLPFHRLSVPIAKKFNEYMQYSTQEDLKRVFLRLSQSTISDDDVSVKEASNLHAKLSKIYSTAEVCELNDNKTCYELSPYLERLMQVEKDYDRLIWAWKGWHDNCGDAIRPVYVPYVDLLNKNVKDNGYKDLAESWIQDYEMGNDTEFEGIIDQILKDIMPFYTQLHAFVRGRLCEVYPKRFDCNGPIPAHILGNMWAQQWHNRLDDLTPYPNEPLVNLTLMLYEKHYTINRMYKTAEDFFTSINLYPMTPKFWARSMFTKPTDRDAVCQPSAFNMGYHNDYRVKICTVINEDYFYTIHHEMGHVEYYMSYEKGQPYVFRSGANSGFHEAIGDTIGMYAISPTHLVRLGFIDEEIVTSHYQINYLMYTALQKVAFLPFAYVMDKYRLALFRNQINQEELNAKWWELRIQYGGIMAPVPRNDPENFDPGAKYHIPSNTPYFRYFIAHILQFQFYRAMCRLQGHTKQLHMCDIYGNKRVGERFKEMLAMGSSKPWSEVLKTLTGEDQLEPEAMLHYFEPLYKWLKMENLARGYPVGWT